MNFDLDEGQREFAGLAEKFFSENASPAHARDQLEGKGEPAPGLAAIAELGFLGITVPESEGGIGQSMLDLAVVAEQAGRALASPSMVTPARAAVLLAGHPEHLAALADGSVAYAVVDGDGPTIDAATATKFLALQGTSLVLASGSVKASEPIDPTRGLGTVTLTDTEVLVEDATELWERGRLAGYIAIAAEDLGTAQKALDVGVEYGNMREAFGRKIGSYQAIKHALVDVYVDVEQLRSLVWWAAWAFDHDPDEAALAAHAAKARASKILERASETLIQVHGGIGFTWEHDAHLYWRRAKTDRLLLGDANSHFNAVAELSLASA